jgi:acetyl-CoA carboxylase biotin carboxyl carrier protein
MDIKELQAIMDLFEKSCLSEMTLKRNNEEICLKKAVLGSAPVVQMHSTPVQPIQMAGPAPAVVAHTAAPAAAQTAGAAVAQPVSDAEVIRAPLVGTFYRAPAPDAPPFVEKGDKVKKGQTLCILEAMKLMNEFQAEYDCLIVNILAENSKMVEFGTPLFEVRKV